MTPEERECIGALQHLVDLRKLRDKINDGSASNIEIKQYTNSKALAWHRAFLAVARLG